MSYFNLQSRMIQTESLVAQLAQFQFDSRLEEYYNQAGANMQYGDAILNLGSVLMDKSPFFKKDKAHKSILATFRAQWAVDALSSLLYSKADAQGIPLFWILKGKELSNALNTLKPYFECLDLQTHAGMIQRVLGMIGNNIAVPNEIISAIKSSGNLANKDAKSELVLAVQAVLNNTLVIYNRPIMNKTGSKMTGYETCFLTRNVTILQTLASQGLIAVPTGANPVESISTQLNTCLKSLYGDDTSPWGTTTMKALSSGKVACAKLVFTRNEAGRDVFKLTTPPGGLDIANETAQMLPVRFMYQYCEGLLGCIMGFKSAEIAIADPILGAYTRKVTADARVFAAAYSDCPKELVAERMNTPVGLALRQGRLVLLNLESSIYASACYAKVNPFYINSINGIPLAAINRGIHNVDPINLTAYFLKAVSIADKSTLKEIVSGIPSLERALDGKEISVDNINNFIRGVDYTEIYRYMSTVDSNLDRNLLVYGSRQASSNVALAGNTNEEKIKSLYAILDGGIARIKYNGSNGVSEILATNVVTELMKVWGNDYQLTKNESWKVRANALYERALRDKLTTKGIQDLVTKYGIPDLDVSQLKSNAQPDILAWLSEAASKRPEKHFPDDTVVVRTLNRLDSFYKSLKIDKIISVSLIK